MALSGVSREQILAKLKSDDLPDAVRLSRESLTADPDNADVLGLLGNALKAMGDFDGGANAFRRAMSLRANPSIKLRNMANFAALLIASEQRPEAAELLDIDWGWVADMELGANERLCVALIGDVMNCLDIRPAILALTLPIVEKSQYDWAILKHAVRELALAGRYGDALRLLDEHGIAHPQENERHAVLSYVYAASGRTDDAEAARAAYIAKAPVFIAATKAKPWFTIGIINPIPQFDKLITSVDYQHFHINFPAQMARRFASRYRFTSVLFGSGPSAVEDFCKSNPRLVINNIAVAEQLLSGEKRLEVERLTQRIGAPVINGPERVSLCTRQMNFDRLANLNNVIAPRIKRFTLDLNRLPELQTMIEQSFAYPMIIRTAGDHDGKGMVRVESGPALRDVLMGFGQKQIYVIQYLNQKHFGKYHRKLRASFVAGMPTVMRADYDHNWIVLGRLYAGRREFYQEHPELLADANDIVSRPLERLGAPAMAALEAIGQSMPLDIFGLDFDVDDQGAIVFFEANASMNLFGRAVPEFPFPPVADAALMDHLEQFLQRKGSEASALPHPTAH